MALPSCGWYFLPVYLKSPTYSFLSCDTFPEKVLTNFEISRRIVEHGVSVGDTTHPNPNRNLDLNLALPSIAFV
jgi:hypothetical protein